MDVQLSDSTSSGFSAAAASIGLTLPQPVPSPQQSLAPVPSAAPQAITPPDTTDPVSLSVSSQTKSIAAVPKIDSHLGEAASAFFHAPRPLSVEFHTDRHPNEIVTILRDPATGQVYAEFPPDAVARLADFFNHLAGFVVDQKA